MKTILINAEPEEKLFIEAEQIWNLPAIYEEIESTKQKLFGEKQLTSLQKTILRGLLCNYSPQEIATRLPGSVEELVVNLSWTLHRCVQTATGMKAKAVENYQDIPDWLEKAGYQIQTASRDLVEQKSNKADYSPKKEKISPKDPYERQNTVLVPPKEKISPKDPSNYQNTVLISKQNVVLHLSPDSQIESPPQDLDAVSLVPSNHQSQLSLVPQEEVLAVVDENDFLPSISRWTKLGGLVMVGSVSIAIALAAFTPYNVTVKAQAKIRPASGLKVVEAETQGTIIDIRAKENQVVKKGEAIAVIDNSRLATRRSQLENTIQQTNLQLRQIQAQIISQNNRISAENERINRAVASAQSQLHLRYREYQDRQITTNAQVTEAQANLGLAQEELNQAQTDLTSAQAKFRSAEIGLTSALSRQNRYQQIAASGALSQNQLEEAQLTVQQRQQDVVAQQAAIERQQREIARRRQAIAAARARLRNVQAALNPSNAEVAIATDNIAQEQATGKATLASLKREKEALIQQNIEIQNQLERYTSELQQLEKDLQQTTIKAPADGVLFKLKLKNPGQTVLPGEEIAHIAPSNTSLSIQALVPAQEISNLEVGQTAQAKISACPYPDYGTLKGAVTNISPDASIPQVGNSTASSTAGQVLGANFYEVIIEPESLALKKHNKECSLQLGMGGVADIITKEETVLRFMLRKARLLTDL